MRGKKHDRGAIRRWVEEHIVRDEKPQRRGARRSKEEKPSLMTRMGIGAPPIDAVEMLKAQHKEARELMKQLEKNPDREQFLQLAMALAGHMSIEENIFYPALREFDEETMLYSAEEHLSAKRILADLIEMDVDDPIWLAKFCLLAEQIEHHIEEEEDEVFPMARRHLDEDHLLGLGQEMAEMMVDTEETNDQGALPEVLRQTEEAAPL